MVNINVKVKTELFKALGVSVGQLNAFMDEEHNLRVNGSVSVDDVLRDDKLQLGIKANMCDVDGNILYIERTYGDLLMNPNKYDTFTMFCTKVSRFFDINELSYVEVYPVMSYGK